jgi:hypothetical protein
MKVQRFRTEDLIKEDWVLTQLSNAGVRSDILLHLRRHAKEFKAIRKAHRSAAQGLAQLMQQGDGSTATSLRQEFGMGGEDTSASFFDSY